MRVRQDNSCRVMPVSNSCARMEWIMAAAAAVKTMYSVWVWQTAQVVIVIACSRRGITSQQGEIVVLVVMQRCKTYISGTAVAAMAWAADTCRCSTKRCYGYCFFPSAFIPVVLSMVTVGLCVIS